MASVQNVVSGPSKWDLMQSMFTGQKVKFTLDSGFIVEGRVATLHDHKLEDTIVEDPNFTYTVVDFHDWLILIEPLPGGNFYQAVIEYHEKSRTGPCVVLSDDEHERLSRVVPVYEIYYMPSVWTRMMDPEHYN